MKTPTKIFSFMIFHIKHLRIKFNKTDGFIRIYDESKYLVLFGPEKYDTI